jgi:hypothetical protein
MTPLQRHAHVRAALDSLRFEGVIGEDLRALIAKPDAPQITIAKRLVPAKPEDAAGLSKKRGEDAASTATKPVMLPDGREVNVLDDAPYKAKCTVESHKLQSALAGEQGQYVAVMDFGARPTDTEKDKPDKPFVHSGHRWVLADAPEGAHAIIMDPAIGQMFRRSGPLDPDDLGNHIFEPFTGTWGNLKIRVQEALDRDMVKHELLRQTGTGGKPTAEEVIADIWGILPPDAGRQLRFARGMHAMADNTNIVRPDGVEVHPGDDPTRVGPTPSEALGKSTAPPTRLADLLPGDHKDLAGGDPAAASALFDDPSRRQALSRGLAAVEGQPEVRARLAGELLQGLGGDFLAAHATFARRGSPDVADALDQHRSRALAGMLDDLRTQFPDLQIVPRRLNDTDPTITLELSGGSTRQARAYLEASAGIELGGSLRHALGVELSQAPVRVHPAVEGAEAAAGDADVVKGTFRDRLAHLVPDGAGGVRREFIPDGRGGAQAYVGQYGFEGVVGDDGTYVVRKAIRLIDQGGADLEQVRQRMHQAVEEWYNQPGHRVTVDGVERQIRVLLDFVDDTSQEAAGAAVAVGRGTGHHTAGKFYDQGSDQHSDEKAHRQVLAHELGHLIFGLADNYQDSGGVDVGVPGQPGKVHASSGYRTYDGDSHNIGDRGMMDNFTGRYAPADHQAGAGETWASLAERHGPGLLQRYQEAGLQPPVRDGRWDFERMLKDDNPHLFDPRRGFAEIRPGDVVRVPRQTASDEAGLNERHLKQIEWLIGQSRARRGGAVDFELGDGGEIDRLAREGKENEVGRGLLHQNPEFKRLVHDLGLEDTGPMAAPAAKPNRTIDEELAELKRRLAEHPESFPELEADPGPARSLPVATGPRPDQETTAPMPGTVRRAGPDEVTGPMPGAVRRAGPDEVTGPMPSAVRRAGPDEVTGPMPGAPAQARPQTHAEISQGIQEATRGRSRTQTSGDIDELYHQAAEADVHLREATQRIAGLTGGEVAFPPGLKGKARAQEKVETEYGGDYSQLTDISRASIQYDSMDALYRGLQALGSEFEIARLKDRFQTPAPGGYRDMLLNVRMPNGHVVEVQLHLKEILAVKGGRGHAIYEEVRTIQANAAREGRDFTADETRRMTELTAESEGLYGAAYQRALGHLPASEQAPVAPAAPPALAPDEGPTSPMQERARREHQDGKTDGRGIPARALEEKRPQTHAEISQGIQEATRGRSRTQSTGDMDELYHQAAEADVHLREATQRIAGLTGGEAMFPPGLKGRARAQEKVETEYGGDASQLTDLSRASIQYDSMDALYRGLQALGSEFEIARLKDRFQTPAPGGYRDMLLNVRMPNGHVVEVQLHLKEILAVKGGRGHAIYEEVRTIQANAAREGRDFTADETRRMADLTAESEGLYGAAYQRALGHPPAGEQAPTAPTAQPMPAAPTPEAPKPHRAAILDLDRAEVDEMVRAGFTKKEALRIRTLREQNGGIFDFAVFVAMNADHEVRVLAKAAKLSGREREAVRAALGPHESEAEAAQRIGLDPRPFGHRVEVERVAEVHNHYKGILPAEEFPGLLFPELKGQPHEAAARTVDLLRRLYREDPDGDLHTPEKQPATARILAILESDAAQRDPAEALRRAMTASAEMPFDFTYDPRGLLIDHMKRQGRAEAFVEATVLSLKRQGVTYAELQGKLNTPGVDPETFAAIGERHGVKIRMLPHLVTQQFAEGGAGFTEEDLHKLLFGKNWKERGQVPDMIAGIDICGPENGRWDEAGMAHMERAFTLLQQQADLSGRKLVLRPHVGEGYSGTEGQRRLGVEEDARQGRIAQENLDTILVRLQKMRDEGTYRPPPEGSVEIRLGHVTQATADQVRRMKDLGVIAEVNIGSNLVTGALGRARGGSASRLEEHPLLLLLYHGVPTLLSTDAQGVMSTDLSKEYGFAADLVDRFRRGEIALTVPDPKDPEQQIRVRFKDLPPELQDQFDVRRLENAAQDYAEEARGARHRAPGGPSDGVNPASPRPRPAPTVGPALTEPGPGRTVTRPKPGQTPLIGLHTDFFDPTASSDDLVQQIAEEGIPRLQRLTAEERAAESTFADWVQRHPNMAKALALGIAESLGSPEQPVFEVDAMKRLLPDYGEGSEPNDEERSFRLSNNHALHPTAVALARMAFVGRLDELAALPEDHPRRQVFVTNGGCAAGKSLLTNIVKDALGDKAIFGAVWDAAGEGDALENAWILRAAQSRGIKVVFGYAEADPTTRYQGALERAKTTGRVVDVLTFVNSYSDGAAEMRRFLDSPEFRAALAAGQATAHGIAPGEFNRASRSDKTQKAFPDARRLNTDGPLETRHLAAPPDKQQALEASLKILEDFVRGERAASSDPTAVARGALENALKFLETQPPEIQAAVLAAYERLFTGSTP